MTLSSLQKQILQAIVRGSFVRRPDAPPVENVPELKELVECGLIAMRGRKARITEDGLGALEAAEQQALKRFTVTLSSAGNPDFGQSSRSSLSPRVEASVSDFSEASRICREYIAEHNLGSGNWTGGEIKNADGRAVARVSYNGRVWPVLN